MDKKQVITFAKEMAKKAARISRNSNEFVTIKLAKEIAKEAMRVAELLEVEDGQSG